VSIKDVLAIFFNPEKRKKAADAALLLKNFDHHIKN